MGVDVLVLPALALLVQHVEHGRVAHRVTDQHHLLAVVRVVRRLDQLHQFGEEFLHLIYKGRMRQLI